MARKGRRGKGLVARGGQQAVTERHQNGCQSLVLGDQPGCLAHRGDVPVAGAGVAGPATGCRGTVQLRANQRVASTAKAVRIPPGESRIVTVRLTRAAKRLEGGEFDVGMTWPGGQRRIIS